MQNEFVPDDLCQVWQSQGPVPAPPPPEELRRQAGRFRAQILWRNGREYLVSALMVPYFVYGAWTARAALMQVGNGLMVAGLLYMMVQLHRRASAAPAPAELGGKTCAAFHRAQLERQRDALRGVWKWYLSPLVPGLATIVAAGGAAAFRHSALAGMLAIALAGGFLALALWGLGRLNRNAADRLQKQIDAWELDGR